ncbi:hypothetical protein HPB52_012426 [Rhipicephalus sanguineus]|uniref:Peptidase M13 N-terminal domain-containing protein n=1 Tax=Rhipicephalus sanguineus TaxID=34632 RepID=A0A9D4SYC5_RHISA|nr:hypothetical protein HPB52_012426 [Rhipicephalus sanguineus]
MDRAELPASTAASTEKADVAPVHKSPRPSRRKSSSRSNVHHHEGHHGKRRASEKAYFRNPISRAFKAKGEQDSRSESSRLAVSAVIALATLLVSALTTSIMTWLLPSGGSVHHLLTQRIQSVCNSHDCRSAVRLLDLSLDSGANACHDAYDFVCGHWKSTGHNGSTQSYHESLHDQYVPLAHNTLTAQRSRKSSGRPEVRQLVKLYSSCLAFFSNESSNLQELWKAAGVDAAKWLNVTGFAELVSLIVSSAYRNKMPSMVHVQWSDRGGTEVAIVRTGRSLKTDAPVSDIVSAVLDRVPDGLTPSSTKAEISAEFLRIEDTISNITEASTSYEPALPVAATALDMPGLRVTWARLLNRTGIVTAFMCNSISGVRGIVDTLASTQLRVAALYALLVPFSSLVGLDVRAAEHRGHNNVAAKRKICLGSVELLLPKTFQRTLRKVVDVKAAMVDVFLMCKRLLMVSEHHLTIAKDVKLNATLLKEACALGVSNAEAGAGSGEAVLKTKEVWHGDDFAVNLVLYTGATGRAVNVSEMLVENLRRRRFVPLALMLPDFYYSHATEPSINYATLGVFLAEMVAEHAMPEQRTSEYKKCFATYAKAQLALTLPFPDVDHVWRTRWAMIASQKASSKDGRDLDLTASRRLAQLYYLRFAHTFCGERDKTRLLALRYAVMTSQNYAETFDCAKPKPIDC